MEREDLSSVAGLKTMQLNDQKAGMQGLNKEAINKVIYEASKGTPYFAFQEKRQKSINSKVNELLANVKKITEFQRKDSLEKMSALGSALEAERDLTHSIVHIDMDAFFAAVEMLDGPHLKEKPMAVGSLSMLSTSNYEARKYGVRAAMPGFIAKKLCPELVILPCNFDKYRKVSHKVRDILKTYDPDFSPASLDEAYLDLTVYIKDEYRKQLHLEYCLKKNFCEFFSDEENDPLSQSNYEHCITCSQPISLEKRDKMAYDIVEEIRKKIYETTQLTASAGIAPNTMLAKVCSDQNKPNGQYQICSTVEAVKSFISTLPVKKISGIGPVQGQILNAIGIHTCADIWEKRDIVGVLFSTISVDFYIRVGLGIGSTTVKSEYIRKSIGVEHTFKDTHQRDELYKRCMDLCEEMIEDLKSHKMMGKVVVLKIKTSNFETHTRNHSLAYHTDDQEIICRAAKKLLDFEISAAAPHPLTLRLMGIRMEKLVPEGELPNSEKQPVKLTDFLLAKSAKVQSSSKQDQVLICPVFQEEYETYSKAFNEHVANCLNSSKCTEMVNEGEHKNTEWIDLSMSTNASAAYDSEAAVSDNISVQSAGAVENNTVSNDSLTSYSCPVCMLSQNVTSLAELNMHIDNCLNRVAIKEILSNDIAVNKKRKLHFIKHNNKLSKTDNKMKRIDDYFQ